MLWKTTKYIWYVCEELISLGVVLVMFKAASTHFETAVICALVIIYLGINNSYFFLVKTLSELSLTSGLLIQIAQKNGIDTSQFVENNKAITEANEKGLGKVVIWVAFQVIIWVVVLVNLISIL